MNPARSCLFSLTLAALAACQTTPEHPEQWVETTAAAPTDAVLWELSLMAIEEQGFPVGGGANPATMTATTGWRLSLAPFKSQGYRERVHLKLEPAEGSRFKLALHVQRETNENLARPMDVRYAEWEPAPDDEAMAKILISKINARIGERLTVGEAPVKRR